MTSIATLGSHCSLQVLKGAKDEGFKTILVCEKKREKLYRRFSFIDELIIVEKFSDILKQEIQDKLKQQDAILIAHGTLIFFYSPLTNELEFFGVDQRHESDIEGLGRIPSEQQLKSNKVPSFNVIGNSPLVLRESLLDEVYTMGENFVEAAKRVVSPGMNGPFCIEGVYDENAKFTSFEFSARIVAGTNIYMDGSPYYSLLFNENMSMGKRIAREIKTAESKNMIEKIVTWV